MSSSISVLVRDCLTQFEAILHFNKGLCIGIHPSAWTDELGRLRVWVSNVEAKGLNQRSLDYRLRDASHLRNQIIRLLRRIQHSLVDLEDLAREQSPRNLRSVLNESDLEEEGQLVYWEIGESIRGLYQLESHILHPAPHDALINIGHFQATHTEDPDTRMVLTRYPHAETWTAARLGAANSRRRALLEYYKERCHEMFGEHDKISSDRGRDESAQVELSSCRRHSLLDDQVNSRYKVRVSIPAPPSGPNMICSLCFHLVEVGDLASWVQHLHTDLKPYMCLAPSCADHLFDGRAEWKKHLYDHHKIHEPNGSMPRCPLCHEILPDPLILEEHTGMHLEELCLLVLTPDALDRVPSPDVTAGDVPERHSNLWICCACGDGPKSYAHTQNCILCSHTLCHSCTWVL